MKKYQIVRVEDAWLENALDLLEEKVNELLQKNYSIRGLAHQEKCQSVHGGLVWLVWQVMTYDITLEKNKAEGSRHIEL